MISKIKKAEILQTVIKISINKAVCSSMSMVSCKAY